jgi:hypothetical protein
MHSSIPSVANNTVLIFSLVSRGAFMFLKPSLSEVSIIYFLPFSQTVWITFTLTIVILTFGQELSNRLHKKVNKSETGQPTEWSEAILNSIGIVCEQGKGATSTEVLLCVLRVWGKAMKSPRNNLSFRHIICDL